MNEAIHQLRLMQESDLEMVLSWRNHSDIQKHMYSRHEISLSEHRDWFANASNDPNTDLFVFEIDRKPTGFVKFGAKAAKKNAEWGFYIAPDAPRGSGSALGNASLNHAFNTLLFHKISAEVLAENEQSLKFHKKLGFIEEGRLQDQYFDGKKYQDVICLGILSTDWQSLGKAG